MKKKKQRQRSNNKAALILIGAGAVLLVIVAVWLALSAPSGPPAQAQAEIPLAEIERVSLADAKTAFDQNRALFLDVRDPESYAASHIPGARNIPLTNLESRLNELSPDQWIITYCT